MKLEDLGKAIPETPDFIHQMIMEEVQKQTSGESKGEHKIVSMEKGNRNIKKKKYKWTAGRVAATAAICVLSTSTIVFAGSHLYQLFLEKTGAYSVSIGISSDSTKIGVPKKVSDVAIQAGYIPEGMEWNDDRHLQYSETPNLGGFSFTTVLLDSDDMDQVQRDTGVIESEEMTFGNRDGVYVRYQDGKQDGSFNQRIYMVCPEQYCVLIMYIGDDVSKDDAIKVAENITLQETDTVLETADMYTWSDYVSPAQEIGADAINTVKDEKLSIYNIGEPLALSVSGEDVEGNHMASEDISVTVDSVQVADDLELLKENDIPKAWLSAVDSEGKLIQNELSYIKNGDGIETLDEVIRKEIDNQKLVYVTATYTNQGDSQINHLLYNGTLMLLNHKNGMYQIYDYNKLSGPGYDRVDTSSVAKAAEMTYCSVQEDYGNGRNYIASLRPGESVQVIMAWIVNEGDLDNMYLNLTGDGAAFDFTDEILEHGVVNICQ